MEDVIRKAVELAYGWELIADCAQPPWNVVQGPAFHVSNPSTILMDALAAQLTRQVDAVEGLSLDSKGGKFPEVIVWDFRPGQNRMAGSARGPDRTMNTIKAIVDSKVLERDD